MTRSIARSLVALALALVAFAQPAHATWSIIIVDVRTGEIAIGSATCLTGFDLQANASVVVQGIGAAAAQSAVDSTGVNRVFIHDQMLRSVDPSQIITLLSSFDSQHQSRQYGIVDIRDPGHAATFTGSGAGLYRGGRTGRITGGGVTGGDLVYSVQGNVLTGAPVIDLAVAALQSTSGDLAAKLMAAMEAARSMGGDGRCSCSGSNPTGCGSPPPNFTKSAHIGYMIVSRAGDREGCNGLYRTSASGPVATIAADINRDNIPDLVSVAQATSSVVTHFNTIASGQSTFSLPSVSPVGTSPRDLVSADFNHDGFADIATANFTTSNVSVLLNVAPGALAPRVDYAAGPGPIGIVAGDFNTDGSVDLAVINQTTPGVTILLNDGTGVFTAQPAISLPDPPLNIAVADLDSDSDADLVVTLNTPTTNTFMILRNSTQPNSPLSLTPEPRVNAGRGVSGLAVADLNNDTRPDIIVTAATDLALNVFLQTPTGFAAPVPYPFATLGTYAAARDVTGDSIPDLVCLSRGSPVRFGYLQGRGDGTFLPARYVNIGQTTSKFTLVDLDNDGDLDFAAPLTSLSQVITIRNFGRGQFNSGIGCASGDYWLDFNVANQQATDPDPVLTLRAMFDTWRADLGGFTDAVHSSASLSRPVLRADGRRVSELTITLRDFQGNPVVDLPSRVITIDPAPSNPLGLAQATATRNPDGTYRATLTASRQVGSTSLIITVRDTPSDRPVILMPQVPITLVPRSDWNESGAVDSTDLMDFLTDFMHDQADFNADGLMNSQDFFDFLTEFLSLG